MTIWLQRGRVWIDRRLQRRIIAYSVTVILSISLIFGAISLVATLWIIRQHHHMTAEQKLDRIVARLDDKVELFVRHTQDLSKNPIVFSALLDSSGRNTYLLPFFARYQFPLEEPHGLALCDFEGTLLAQQKVYPVGCLTEWPQSQAVMNNEQLQATLIAIEHKPYLALFQPVSYPGTGRTEGYIVAALDLEALVAEKNLAGPQATLTLRSADGHLQFVTRVDPPTTLHPSIHEQSVRMLFANGPFNAIGLSLTLDEPADVLAGIAPVLAGYGLGTLALLTLALALSHQLARRVAEPLLTLNRTARQITAEGLTTDLIASERIDEIGELTDSFNHMVTALRQSQEGLEAQVHARTEELRYALANVEQSESRFHTLVDLLPYGVQESDLTHRITFANPALERLHGSPVNGLDGQFIWDFLADDDERATLRDYLQLLVREQPPPTPYFTKNRRPDGSIIDVEVNWTYRYDECHQLQGFITVVTNITERKQMQAALQERAIRDPLTGLFNRRYLDETLPRELSRCQRSGEPLAVAMLDLDHFKRFNNAYGHAAGDTVLQAVGDLLQRSLRTSDIACRYGGEELTIVMPGSSLNNARSRLDDLRQILMNLRLCYPQGELPAVTMSVGIAEATLVEFDAAKLLARADAALYQAKRQGRNQTVVIANESRISNP